MSNEPPIACDATAISAEEREEHGQVIKDVFAATEELREQPDGYSFRLPTDTEMIQKAGAFVSRERLCCPFLSFTLEVKPNRGPVWLSVTGRAGAKQFLKDSVVSQLDV